MKKMPIFPVILPPLLVLTAMLLFGGSSIHWHSEYVKLQADTQAQLTKPVAVIGLVSCDKWYGAAVVMGNGQIDAATDVTSEDAQALAKTLPDGTSVIAKIPCEGQGT